jgi:hypothetical protein
LNLQNNIANIMFTSKDVLPTVNNATLDERGSPIPHTSNINKQKRKHEDNVIQISPRKRLTPTDKPQTSRHPSINQFSDTPSINPADLTRTFSLHPYNAPKPFTITTPSSLPYPHHPSNTSPPQRLQKSQTNVGMKHKRQQVALRLWIWVAMLRSHCRDLGILSAEHEKNIKEMEALVVEYDPKASSSLLV